MSDHDGLITAKTASDRVADVVKSYNELEWLRGFVKQMEELKEQFKDVEKVMEFRKILRGFLEVKSDILREKLKEMQEETLKIALKTRMILGK